MDTKTCARCKISKPIENFGKDRGRKDGHNKYCRECTSTIYYENHNKIREAQNNYYHDNKERINDERTEWRKQNPDIVRGWWKTTRERLKAKRIAYNANWIKANPEKYKEYVRKCNANRLDKHAEEVRRRRARLNGNYCEKVDRQAIIERDQYTCQICGKGPLSGRDLTLDHIVPITKGGPHIVENLQVACFSCNCRKGNR